MCRSQYNRMMNDDVRLIKCTGLLLSSYSSSWGNYLGQYVQKLFFLMELHERPVINSAVQPIRCAAMHYTTVLLWVSC